MSDQEERMKSAAKLESMGRDLTQLALEDKLGLVYEREEEIKALAALLSTGEINVILVGKSGAGKNAIVEGLAKWIVVAQQDLPPVDNTVISPFLENKSLIETGADAFQFGCMYVHEFETKLKYIIDECKKENAILFLDNINMVISAGSTGESPQRTLANLLNPYLSGRELTIIGATTPEGYETMLKKNQAFTNRFVKLEVLETSSEQTKSILQQLKEKFENKFNVFIDDQSLDSVVDLSLRFYPERSLPGKAFELLNETISWKMLVDRKLTAQDVYKIVQRKTGFPDFIVHRNHSVTKEEIRDFFSERLFGQDHAIDMIVNSILAYKSELNDPKKPIGTFLFSGPTGVGKTELAKLLAEFLFGSKARLHKYDMPNYADDRGITRLIEGSRFNGEPGKLFSDTTANPCCVTLFDEVEKAHKDIFNILLPVLDEGQLVDRFGQVAFFYNSIIIMTSNLGADLYQKRPIGIGPVQTSVSDDDIFNKIKERFSPEFINRIGQIIYFKPLSKANVKKIVRKELDDIFYRSGFSWRKLKVEIDDKVIELIIDKGYSVDYGARAIQRAAQQEIVNPLAALLSSKKTLRDKTIKLTAEGNRVKVVCDN